MPAHCSPCRPHAHCRSRLHACQQASSAAQPTGEKLEPSCSRLCGLLPRQRTLNSKAPNSAFGWTEGAPGRPIFGNFSAERPFRCYPPIRSSPRHSPSACPESRRRARLSSTVRLPLPTVLETTLGHNYLGRSYIGHNYLGHSCIGHNYLGHSCIGITIYDHNYIGHNCLPLTTLLETTLTDALSTYFQQTFRRHADGRAPRLGSGSEGWPSERPQRGAPSGTVRPTRVLGDRRRHAPRFFLKKRARTR